MFIIMSWGISIYDVNHLKIYNRKKLLTEHEIHVKMKCDNLLALPHSLDLGLDLIMLICCGEMLGVMHNILTKYEQIHLFT